MILAVYHATLKKFRSSDTYHVSLNLYTLFMTKTMNELALWVVNSGLYTDLFELRRRLMEHWAGYQAAEKASVTAIR